MDLPDPVTGACANNGVPIYRVFNNRTDANHRYTTSIAIRDADLARGAARGVSIRRRAGAPPDRRRCGRW